MMKLHADMQKLKRQILKKSEEVTDQELFTSNAYADYQSRLAEAATGRYLTGVQVQIS